MAEAEYAKPAMTAEMRYDSLMVYRTTPLMRAREAARLTIPGLMPPEGSNDTNTFFQPFQSLGARGVNSLASKFLLALFPPGSSFFRLTMDDYVIEKLAATALANGQNGEDARATFEAALSKVERAVVTRMEQRGTRPPLLEALKQLIVCGNALVQILPDGRLVLHRLDTYVVKRDPTGEVIEIVLKQNLSRMTLPERARVIVETQQPTPENTNDKTADNTVALFTRISRRTRGSSAYWYVCQEILGITIPESEGSYPIDKTPWLPLRFSAVPAADYGRGLVEEYIGDIRSLEDATQSIIEFGKAASKILILVNEAGVTSKKKLQDAPSGTIMDGDLKDIGILMLDKFADFQTQKSVSDGIEKRLEQAFLLATSIQRDAERVTAEEIRFLAQELETNHSGPYSIFATEFQRPLVVRYMLQMQKEGKLPALPDAAVSPQIVTGLEALGRNADLQKLAMLTAGLNETFGPDTTSDYIDVGGYLTRKATALGMDSKGIVRSAEQVAAIQDQRSRQQLTEKLGPNAINAASKAQTSPATQPTQ